MHLRLINNIISWIIMIFEWQRAVFTCITEFYRYFDHYFQS
jgi:hypothetical protein